MANFFPRWTNSLTFYIIVGATLVCCGIAVGLTYYFTPKYTRVGYTPSQPVSFDHSLHVGGLGMDCRYCHSQVENASHSNVPASEVCMNCHGPTRGQIHKDSDRLAPIRDSFANDKPVDWVKIHHPPDYVYFAHRAHVNRGVSCVSCHGKVNEMKIVRHDQPMSMSWCLDCHRNPENALRPVNEVTNLDWKPSDLDRGAFYKQLIDQGAKPEKMLSLIEGEEVSGDRAVTIDELLAAAKSKFGEKVEQKEVGLQLKNHWQIQPPESCGACHR